LSARISSLPVVVSANIADTDILPIVTGIASNTGVTKRVSITELRLKLGTTAPAGGRTVTSASTYLTNNAVFNVKDFGAIGNGLSNPLSGFFGTLAAAQAVYPHAVALTDEMDWAAIQAAINAAPSTAMTSGRDIMFKGGGQYRVNRPILVTSVYHARFFAPATATIDGIGLAAGVWTVDVDLSALAPNFASFGVVNVSIIDSSQARTRKGIRLNRVLLGRFERMNMYGFLTMMDAKNDSDHNRFVNCFFSNNQTCHTSSDSVAVVNIFDGCNWQSSDVVFDGTWSETVFIGGDMEPSNGLSGNPFFITGDNCVATGLRLERNTNNQEWIRVGTNCRMDISIQGDGAHQANPALNFNGDDSVVTVRVGTAAQLASFSATSNRNKLILGKVTPLVPFVFIVDNNPTAGNVVESSLGITGRDIHTQRVPSSVVSSYLDDTGVWVRSNMTSVLPVALDYQAIANGAGAPKLRATPTGTFANLFVAFTGIANNASGAVSVSINGGTAISANLSTTIRRRVYLAFNGPWTNPTIDILMAGSGAGSAFTIGAMGISDVGFTASGDASDPRFQITVGTGAPGGVVAASPGAIYLRRDGGAATTLYVKESGINTTAGWVAK
jgi:hypothetical protein